MAVIIWAGARGFASSTLFGTRFDGHFLAVCAGHMNDAHRRIYLPGGTGYIPCVEFL
jgi:hypothetical protein